MTSDKKHPVWWGEFPIPEGSTRYWRIGPFELWIRHLRGEWRIASTRHDEPMDGSLEMREEEQAFDLSSQSLNRFGVSSPSEKVRLDVVLADRAVVTWPDLPFSVPAGQEVTVHVSTPIWVRVSIGEDRNLLAEVPLYRPSDTWFGATTMEGELCYSSRTRFTLHLANMTVVPHRALTAVRILNRASTALSLERVKLPVTHLSLYCAADGALWTEDVTLERTEDDDFAKLRVARRKSGQSTGKRISEPRTSPEENLMVRAFSSILQQNHKEGA